MIVSIHTVFYYFKEVAQNLLFCEMGIMISDPGVPGHGAPSSTGRGPASPSPSPLWGLGRAPHQQWSTPSLSFGCLHLRPGSWDPGTVDLLPRSSCWPWSGQEKGYFLLSEILLSGDSGPLILFIKSSKPGLYCFPITYWRNYPRRAL